MSRPKHDFSKYEIRTGADGKRGIYLKAYNVRIATFNANTATFQGALNEIFRSATVALHEARPAHPSDTRPERLPPR